MRLLRLLDQLIDEPPTAYINHEKFTNKQAGIHGIAESSWHQSVSAVINEGHHGVLRTLVWSMVSKSKSKRLR